MSDNRREALEALRDVIRDGVKYETMGHTRMCQKAFPKPDDFDGSREAYANSAAQQAVLVWRNGDINAAKALHDAVLPGWRYSITHGPSGDAAVVAKRLGEQVDNLGVATDDPARAWLIGVLSALISETPKGETP